MVSLPASAWGAWRKPQKVMKIAGVVAKIKTKHLPKTSQELPPCQPVYSTVVAIIRHVKLN
jgi:hypothetical protein